MLFISAAYQVVARDMSQYMIEILTSEVDKFTKNKDKFLNKFSLDDFNYIRSGWLEKTGRVRDGDQVVKDLLVVLIFAFGQLIATVQG